MKSRATSILLFWNKMTLPCHPKVNLCHQGLLGSAIVQLSEENNLHRKTSKFTAVYLHHIYEWDLSPSLRIIKEDCRLAEWLKCSKDYPKSLSLGIGNPLVLWAFHKIVHLVCLSVRKFAVCICQHTPSPFTKMLLAHFNNWVRVKLPHPWGSRES